MVASASSAASIFKQRVLRYRPRKTERPPDKAEVSINAAFYGASMHHGDSSLIFRPRDGSVSPAVSRNEPPPPSQHRRSISMFATRTRKTSSVSFSIGDKSEPPSKTLPSSSSASLLNSNYILSPASKSSIEFGGVVCESPTSSTLEVDKTSGTSSSGRRVRKTSFQDSRSDRRQPVAFPGAPADDASETASIRTMPAPRSILKRSSDTTSLRSFKTDLVPSFDEARRKLEVYAEVAAEEEEEEDGLSDVPTAISLPVPSTLKPSPPTSVRTTMSTASRISQMPKRAQTWVVDATKGVSKGASAMGSAILDTAYPSRVQKRITLDEASRPTRSQSQWAIADHILREKTKLPESQRDPAADYHLWNAERLNLNWKMKNKDKVMIKVDEEEEPQLEQDDTSRPLSMISLDGEPLYMTDTSAWLEHCDKAWSFIPQGVDVVNPHKPVEVKRSATAPNPPTQERITFTRRAQSEPLASRAAQDTANGKTSLPTLPEGNRFFSDNSNEVNVESPKSSLLLTPVFSNNSNEEEAAALTRVCWSEESLTTTATNSTDNLEAKEADWEANPRLCDSDELGDELYNAVLNLTLTR